MDRTGPALVGRLELHGFSVSGLEVTADGIIPVAAAIRKLSEGFCGLVVTAGGSGFAPTDLTPEATRGVLDREAPGLAEAMRGASPLGRLSRGLAGTIGACLVVNLPGSERGAIESLDAIVDVLPHALDLLGGGDPHP